MNKRQRGLLVMLLWLGALIAPPFTMLVLLTHDAPPNGGLLSSGLFPLGMIVLNVLLFLSVLACSKMESDLSAAENDLATGNRHPDYSRGRFWQEAMTEQPGLRLLRMADNSPLRGKLMERAVIRLINGRPPSSAAEANSFLQLGPNEVEWQDAQGNDHTTTIFVQGSSDLQAQFEQLVRSATQADTAL